MQDADTYFRERKETSSCYVCAVFQLKCSCGGMDTQITLMSQPAKPQRFSSFFGSGSFCAGLHEASVFCRAIKSLRAARKERLRPHFHLSRAKSLPAIYTSGIKFEGQFYIALGDFGGKCLLLKSILSLYVQKMEHVNLDCEGLPVFLDGTGDPLEQKWKEIEGWWDVFGARHISHLMIMTQAHSLRAQS